MKKLVLFLVPLVILLSSCSSKPEKEIVTVETIVKPTIAIAQRPRPVEFDELKVKVITEANVQEVIQEMKDNQGQFLVYALDPVTFKNLAIGIEEIKRYIEQQNDIIVYYEKAVTDEPETQEGEVE
jgi:hypothetical protein|tara:strand:+ start:22 stop:399 length:378 start_codon:yes stop_codon:yes gene_type:complete